MTVKEAIMALFEKRNTPIPDEVIIKLLKLSRADRPLIRAALKELVKEHRLQQSKEGKYSAPEDTNLYTGTIQGTKGDYCFFIPDPASELEEDLYISSRNLNGALHGDKVTVRRIPSYRRSAEGVVEEVIERANKTIVGTYVKNGKSGLVIPDDQRLHCTINVARKGDVKPDYKVVVKVTYFPRASYQSLQGEIIEILGHKDNVGTDILSIIRQHNLPERFDDDVLAAAHAIGDEVTEKDLKGREDLRGARIFTIDGDDAKDFDDAVSIENLKNGNYLLGVHIADVSYYVRPDSIIDKEAQRRGTSVYLVDRVIPMLPPQLSNELCSLKPHVDRLTISVFMEVDSNGEVVSYRITPAVIRSVERMTYANVTKILSHNDNSLSARYAHILDDLYEMEKLMHILRRRREKRGSIDFDLDEAYISLDENGKPTHIGLAPREVSNQIIEEFMLLANETVAKHVLDNHIPSVFRVHELPDKEKIEVFNEFINNFGYHLPVTDKPTPMMFQRLLKKIENTPEENLIAKLMLRSMQKARYSDKNLGHFGLAADYYLHFTSPIRRYPDLLVHRLLRFKEQNNENAIKNWQKRLNELSNQCSERERVADDAERDVDDLKKAEYMQNHIGEEFEGIISGVSNTALWVELPNTIEGMIHVTRLTDDYYVFNEKQYAMIGERNRKVYRLGDKITIKVLGVDLSARRVDFELA